MEVFWVKRALSRTVLNHEDLIMYKARQLLRNANYHVQLILNSVFSYPGKNYIRRNAYSCIIIHFSIIVIISLSNFENILSNYDITQLIRLHHFDE